MTANERPPLSRRTLTAYGLGTLAYGTKDFALGSLLLLYYNQVVGLSPAWVGAAIGICLALDAFIDPVIGYATDNWRSPWGRRHPFMYAAALPAATAFCLLFNPPAGWSEPSLIVYLFCCLLALRVLISFYEVPSAALGPELTLDYDKRTEVMSYRFFFGGAGAGLVAVIAFSIFLQPTPDYPVGQLNPTGYSHFAFFGALVIVASIVISTWGTHHFIPYLYQPPKQKVRPVKALREMLETLSTRNYAILLLSGSLGAVSKGITDGLGIYFNTYYWQLNAQEISAIVALGFFISPFASVIVATKLAKSRGKKWAMIGMLTGGAVFAVTPLCLGLLGVMPPPGSSELVTILAVNFSVVVTLSLSGFILAASMIADLAEEVAVKTARRSEGVLFSADAIIKQTIVGVGTFVAGLMLAWVNFPRGAEPSEIDPTIMVKLALIYVPLLIVFGFSSLGILAFYRHDRKSHEANVAAMRENPIFGTQTALSASRPITGEGLVSSEDRQSLPAGTDPATVEHVGDRRTEDDKADL